MTLFDTNLVVAGEPIDPAFIGTPQQYFDHMLERMSVKSPSPLYTVVVADSKPLTNQGLLLLGGLKPYVWDEDTAQYVPANISDSLYAPTTGKAIFTVTDNVFAWKTPADFWTWSAPTIANLAAGANGTIAYSNGTINAWGTPTVALPAKSVPVTKLVCEAADAGKFAQGQADGTVIFSSVGSARGQFLETAEYALPTKGTTLTIPRPAGAQLVRVVAVAKTTTLFLGIQGNGVAGDYGYTLGEEIEIWSFDEAGGSSSRLRAFNVATSAGSWYVIRQKDFGVTSGTELIKRDASGDPAEINDANWRIKAIYV